MYPRSGAYLSEPGRGRSEDKILEQLLGNIAEWSIDNPAPPWRKELADAGRTAHEQVYSY